MKGNKERRCCRPVLGGIRAGSACWKTVRRTGRLLVGIPGVGVGVGVGESAGPEQEGSHSREW